MTATENLELWDAYDEKEKLLGYDLIRGDALAEGVYHLVSTILIRHRSGDFLLMKRDLGKKKYPGRWESSAGGSVLKGESPLEAAHREMLEETGLRAASLKPIHKYKKGNCIYFCYLAITDGPKDSVTLQTGETIAYRWLNPTDFLAFMDSDEVIPQIKNELQGFVQALLK